MTIQTQFDLYIAVVEMPNHLAFADENGEPIHEEADFDFNDDLTQSSAGSYDSDFDDSSFVFETDEDDVGSISRILQAYRELAFGVAGNEQHPSATARREQRQQAPQPSLAARHFFFSDDDSLGLANRRGLSRRRFSLDSSASIGDDDSLCLSRTQSFRGRHPISFIDDFEEDTEAGEEESHTEFVMESYEMPMNEHENESNYRFVQYNQERVQEVPSKAALEMENEQEQEGVLPPLTPYYDDEDCEEDDDDDSSSSEGSCSSHFFEEEYEEIIVPLKGLGIETPRQSFRFCA